MRHYGTVMNIFSVVMVVAVYTIIININIGHMYINIGHMVVLHIQCMQLCQKLCHVFTTVMHLVQ